MKHPITAQLSSILFEIFKKGGNRIKITNFILFPKNKPVCRYRVYLSNTYGRLELSQKNYKLLEMEFKNLGLSTPLENFGIKYIECILDEVKAGNYTYE